MERILKFK